MFFSNFQYFEILINTCQISICYSEVVSSFVSVSGITGNPFITLPLPISSFIYYPSLVLDQESNELNLFAFQLHSLFPHSLFCGQKDSSWFRQFSSPHLGWWIWHIQGEQVGKRCIPCPFLPFLKCFICQGFLTSIFSGYIGGCGRQWFKNSLKSIILGALMYFSGEQVHYFEQETQEKQNVRITDKPFVVGCFSVLPALLFPFFVSCHTQQNSQRLLLYILSSNCQVFLYKVSHSFSCS